MNHHPPPTPPLNSLLLCKWHRTVVGPLQWQEPKEDSESPPTTITTPELDLPAARTSPLPSTTTAHPDQTVPSSQVSNFDMFKDDDIDLEDLMLAECSHITQAMRKHITSPFSDSQTQYEKDMLIAAVLIS